VCCDALDDLRRRPRFATEVTYWMLLETMASAVLRRPSRERWNRVVDFVDRAPLDADGRAAARALERLSRGLYAGGTRRAPLHYAKLATAADPTWPQAKVWATWLELDNDSPDAESIVRRALAEQPEIADELRKDAFATFPVVARVLRQHHDGEDDDA
jgi:hypothetical protein